MLYAHKGRGDPYGEYMARARAEHAAVVSSLLTAAASRIGRLSRAAWQATAHGAGTVYNAWMEARRQRAAIRELQALDDWMLKDIGIERSQIPSIVEFGRPEPLPEKAPKATSKGRVIRLNRATRAKAGRRIRSKAA